MAEPAMGDGSAQSERKPMEAAPAVRLDVARRLAALELQVRLDASDEVLVLFGPSGSGKTTLLNIVAGLVRPDAGEIAFGGHTVFRRGRAGSAVDVPARHRGVGYVMQSYALFPHMTALENVAYPLGRKPDRHARARVLLDRLSMLDHEAHRPAELSGGQQQRVALARALAAPRPVLLLDEPFAALDTGIRERLQLELRELQQEMRLTVLLVTHRLEDAFALGDRLAVLRAGRIEQVGPVDEVFRRPATAGVAESMGTRNLLLARVVSHGAGVMHIDWDGIQLELHSPAGTPPPMGADVTAYIRPDDVKVVYPDRPLSPAVSHNLLEGRVAAHRQSAGSRVLHVALNNGQAVEVRFPLLSYTPLPLGIGDSVRIALRKEGLILLPQDLRTRGSVRAGP
jgi:molybdate transport system ATP-binding protein